MGKISKTIALVALLVLAGIFLKNIFSKPANEPFSTEIYNYKLKPINFPPKNFPEYNQDRNDLAIQYVRLWKLQEIYKKASETCLKTFADQHPNSLVQKKNLTSLYGIEIGTNYWYELTSSFEKYGSEVCYSFSGSEMENVYADFMKEEFTEEEIAELLNFYETELGKKTIETSLTINDKLLEIISKKQRDANNKEVEFYNNKIVEIQKKAQ